MKPTVVSRICLLAVALALAACSPAAPTAPTSAPKAAVPAATQPAGKTEAKPAAPAEAKPGTVAKPGTTSDPQPELLTDLSAIPTQFNEAPMLAELVKQGKLPPVSQRVPQEPLVIRPTDEVGSYGGTWRGVFTGVADGQNLDRMVAAPMLSWDPLVQKVVPHVLRGWQVSPDGKSTTFFLRKGMKWSDGTPVTMDDVMFWHQDLYTNKELRSAPSSWSSDSAGKEGVWEKIDDHTFRVDFTTPYPSFHEYFAQSFGNHIWTGNRMEGGIAPKHYLQKFHPKYVGPEAATKLAEEKGYRNWVLHMQYLNDGHLNPDLPMLDAWIMKTPTNSSQTVWERNPYYFAVDSAGNQLPYIDRLAYNLVEDLEVASLKALSGELDIQARHVLLDKLPVLIENQQKGNYRVQLARGLTGSDSGFYVQQNFDADAEIAKWLKNKEFRIALSLGMEREQLNEAFWLGLGDPGSISPDPNIATSPGPEWRKHNSVFDRAKANALLDGIGLTAKDSQGCRLRTDGQGPLIMEVTANDNNILDNVGMAQMVAEQWKKNVGLCFTVRGMEEELVRTKTLNRELHIRVHSATGSENVLYSGDVSLLNAGDRSRFAPLYGLWLVSDGQKGVKPEGDLLRAVELWQKSKSATVEERLDMSKEIVRIYVENQWIIGTVGTSPGYQGVWVINNKVGNVPKLIMVAQRAQTPLNYVPTQFYFKQ
jgi:peptide/nickel transport system substrate-binding protein